MEEVVAVLVLACAALLGAIYALFGPAAVAWYVGIAIVVGGLGVLYGWWWMHTWPEHAWRKPGEPGALGLLWRRITRR